MQLMEDIAQGKTSSNSNWSRSTERKEALRKIQGIVEELKDMEEQYKLKHTTVEVSPSHAALILGQDSWMYVYSWSRMMGIVWINKYNFSSYIHVLLKQCFP